LSIRREILAALRVALFPTVSFQENLILNHRSHRLHRFIEQWLPEKTIRRRPGFSLD
jgi:hypothetical protein